ncbi:MAG: hypothetical protein PVF17_07650 [Ignavibacteria bacterium]|jgi:hypothetical protein
MSDLFDTPGYLEILNILKNIEGRLTQVEKALNIEPEKIEDTIGPVVDQKEYDDEKLEFQIGESWLPKVGILVFIIGMVFFLTLPLGDLSPSTPILAGYVLSAVFFFSSKFFKKGIEHISNYIIGGGASIAYLTTLRLHFFGSQQLINSRAIEIILLLILSAGIIYIFAKRNSIYLTALGIFFGFVTAIVNEDPYQTFILQTLLSLSVVYLTLKYFKRGLLIWGIILTYATHFVLYINNPIMGNPLLTIESPQLNLVFILLHTLIFSVGTLLREDNKTEEFDVVICSVLNSAGCYSLFLIITLSTSAPILSIYHLIASIVFLFISTLFWLREKSRYSTFLFSMTGYAALSVTILIQFDTPADLILLCWQSLLVISTALWFRSKFIIIANFVILLIVTVAYFIYTSPVSVAGFSFGIVALISARTLNWQKERLELKTEQMRNAYLLVALLCNPYVLYNVLPITLVGLSILALAVFYFLMSKILKNIKYRWMAILTLLITVVYLMIFGMTSADTTYKIISFLAAGIVLIITSVVYGKIKAGNAGNN